MMILKKIDPLSLAKIHALLGIIFGFFASIIAMIVSRLLANSIDKINNMAINAGEISPITSMFGVVGATSLITYPILFGILFFIIGLIFAGIYNVLASITGGLKLKLEYEKAEVNTEQMKPQTRK